VTATPRGVPRMPARRASRRRPMHLSEGCGSPETPSTDGTSSSSLHKTRSPTPDSRLLYKGASPLVPCVCVCALLLLEGGGKKGGTIARKHQEPQTQSFGGLRPLSLFSESGGWGSARRLRRRRLRRALEHDDGRAVQARVAGRDERGGHERLRHGGGGGGGGRGGGGKPSLPPRPPPRHPPPPAAAAAAGGTTLPPAPTRPPDARGGAGGDGRSSAAAAGP
jgi:hypothetical protein